MGFTLCLLAAFIIFPPKNAACISPFTLAHFEIWQPAVRHSGNNTEKFVSRLIAGHTQWVGSLGGSGDSSLAGNNILQVLCLIIPGWPNSSSSFQLHNIQPLKFEADPESSL